jgi:hypothetical protein
MSPVRRHEGPKGFAIMFNGGLWGLPGWQAVK